MEGLEVLGLCYPKLNSSCRRTRRPPVETALTYGVLSVVTVLTVVLNLLVIISISHFRQLQTTTNLLLLSLAVADFLVGVLQMPLLLHQSEGCWLLGEFMCGVQCFVGFLLISVSVGSMVLISVDRYVAICEPMFYSSRVTVTRVRVSVCLCWVFSVVHSSWILRDFLAQPFATNPCHGMCAAAVSFVEGAVDLVVTLLGPILIIAVLYLRVFAVVVTQARAMRSQVKVVRTERRKKAKKSEVKAARTLGIVVVVFLLCSCPYYCFAVAAESNMVGASDATVEIWLVYLNSTLNPLIYVSFYLWFRKTIKHIFTLQILKAGSQEAAVL